ncbi:hypothetical protein CXB51_010705 [Gossypium anomalum]|uniref:Uncharacterized protein n=1 Tax=Gossypium anomalum TaxID=47600 RepID=A0A8J5Z7P1_9ROSI|nr:hypothetical protein CXB51_010705 [Gossypium anomalum]
MSRYRINKHVFSHPIGCIFVQFCNNVISNENIIYLLDATNGGNDAEINFFLGEGICRESSRKSGESLCR